MGNFSRCFCFLSVLVCMNGCIRMIEINNNNLKGFVVDWCSVVLV